MLTVVLAEKPDQGKKFAKALGKTNNHKKYVEVTNSPIFSGDLIVTWGIGHLVSLAEPQAYDESLKKWSMETLPIIPDNMKYIVNKATSSQFKVVKEWLTKADTIIIATDPDREGENIAYSIFRLCGQGVWQKPKKRLWINSLQEKEIIRGFKNLREASETFNYFIEAGSRQTADWLIGLNLTRYFSLLLQSKKVRSPKGKSWSIGRVQTPTNSLICENYLERKNFKPVPYDVLVGESPYEDKIIQFHEDRKENKFFDKDELELYLENHGLKEVTSANVNEVKKELKSKDSPSLFSLGGLQSHCSTKFGWTASETLEIAQKLYTLGYTSYPRTDSKLITENELIYLKAHYSDYQAFLNEDFPMVKKTPSVTHVNGNKVKEHYAIIPTDTIPKITDLSEKEKLCYQEVVKRTLAMFMDDYRYNQTTVKVNANDVIFKTTGQEVIENGWKVLTETQETEKDENKETLPNYQEGQVIPFKITIESKETKPPQQITEAKLVSDNGLMAKLNLGTPATRAGIIETLKKREYIKNDGKTKLIPTDRGLLLYDFTKNLLVGRPDMTAKWEQYLEKIGEGKAKPDLFISKIKESIPSLFDQLSQESESIDLSNLQNTYTNEIYDIGDYHVVEKEKVYEVTKEGENSSFPIWKIIGKKEVNRNDLEELLTIGKTSKKKSMKSKKGKKFEAFLVLNDKKVNYAFE
ncbi:DNA topoisomerase [Aerococcus mictus]|uniref:DNA topoisomerase n=1 Tax=Aerococcus mictus TaxID=2976810 RepID=UPI0018A77C34|nr:DNA topoisomerase [Aerococcus mictus]MCY3067577.1 DNA topoisomerase [Aerococcus mictus]MCY3080888.1 DNA topoisomerase [Aerococcus mictus]MDK8607498.1 DNA topoisomerase [Lactobacillus paragasseri]